MQLLNKNNLLSKMLHNFLSTLGFTAKLRLLIGSAILGIVGVSVLALLSEQHQLMEERKAAVRQSVEIAYGILERHHKLVQDGKLTDELARQAANEQIRALRYAGDEYFFITDKRPYVVLHPIKPELEGKDASGIKDSKGIPVFTAIVNATLTTGAGFVTYTWPKPGESKPVPKLSYAKAFTPWNWVIGSGVYINDVDAVFRKHALQSGGVAVVLATLLFFIGHIISRNIVEPIAESVRIARAVAAGDLTMSARVGGRDEASQLLRALNDMNTSLNGIVTKVRDGAQSISAGSTQIASGNIDLSSRTEQQASSLEETASSMEELTSAVQHTAGNAQEANQISMSASEVARRGGEVMAEVIDTMKAINDSAGRIADIIGVIDGIAFQTNILALNAAVEAARAGEQGRGFAVVATEVRTLAQRSAAAAREIKALIDSSVGKIKEGSQLVSEAGTTIDEVVGSVTRVTGIVAEIAQASSEQRSGIEQINAAVTQIDGVTQQNAALVEESAAAAQALQEQAIALNALVGIFKTRAQ
jgi:methyl-accepting chemotaxis protein